MLVLLIYDSSLFNFHVNKVQRFLNEGPLNTAILAAIPANIMAVKISIKTMTHDTQLGKFYV